MAIPSNKGKLCLTSPTAIGKNLQGEARQVFYKGFKTEKKVLGGDEEGGETGIGGRWRKDVLRLFQRKPWRRRGREKKGKDFEGGRRGGSRGSGGGKKACLERVHKGNMASGSGGTKLA